VEKNTKKITGSKDNVYHLKKIAILIAEYFTKFLVGVEDKGHSTTHSTTVSFY